MECGNPFTPLALKDEYTIKPFLAIAANITCANAYCYLMIIELSLME
jgi:hypothetical protein